MPDGSHIAVHPPSVQRPAQAREPSLGEALDRLLACAGQGLPPDGVLRDIRALLKERGLLLDAGPDPAAGASRPPLDAAPMADALDARR